MKKLFAVISSASLLLSVGLSNAPAAHAEARCRNATIAGSFGVQMTGTLLEGSPAPRDLIIDTSPNTVIVGTLKKLD